MEFSVMTYNIQLAKRDGLEAIAELIGEADVVAVQEVGWDWFEGAPGNQAQQLAKQSGLNHFRFASAQTVRPGSDPPEACPAPTAEDRPGYGVALLSRFPLGPWTRHRLPRRRVEQRCILSGTVVTPSGPITVMVTQLSDEPKDRGSQANALVRHAQTQATPLLVMGDLGTEANDETLGQLNSFLVNAGGDDTHPTFPADNPEVCVDHVYVSTEVKVVAPSSPLPFVHSEHLPVMAKLEI
ncbi:MAG: endonuclease/exonuclease/phosphatase family protein [Myxococcota bacterium]